MRSVTRSRKGNGVKQTLRLRIASAGLAMGLLLSTATTYGAVAYQQSSSASAESEWQQLGEEFAAPADTAPVEIDGDVFVLPSSGVELVVGPAFEVDAPAEGEFEDQVIVTSPGVVGGVALFSSFGQPSTTYEAFLEGFSGSVDSVEVIDLQEDEGKITAVHRIMKGSETQYMVITVNAFVVTGYHVLEVMVSDADEFADALALLSSGITIDGVPMFATIDTAAIVEIVEQDAQ